jgi:hypothetical protein
MKVDIMEKNERREFLKKIAYKAPAVIALGTLLAPASANASTIAGDPFPTESDDEDDGSTNAGFN